MGIWIKNGAIVIDNSGDPILCDHCPCDVICPTNCCTCCDKYSVTIPAGTYCAYDGLFYEVHTWSSRIFDILWVGDFQCHWESNFLDFVTDIDYYNTGPCPTPSGLAFSQHVTNASIWVSLTCVSGRWVAYFFYNYNVLVQGTGYKTASACPDGSYDNGFSVSDGSPCFPPCCPCTDWSPLPASWPSGGLNQTYTIAGNIKWSLWANNDCTGAETVLCTSAFSQTVTAVSGSPSCLWQNTGSFLLCGQYCQIQLQWFSGKWRIYMIGLGAGIAEKTSGLTPAGSYSNVVDCQLGITAVFSGTSVT